jgi:GMP synthase-like glutamine amidotransferase
MHCHYLQHVSFETPGKLLDHFSDKRYRVSTTALYRGESLPSSPDFDVLVIMGGPMSVHDEDLFPWLRAEKALIAAAIAQGKRVLGICLGAQLIAEVAGARVYPNHEKEIGFWPVTWTQAGRRWLGHDRSADDDLFFHWHGDTFDLPDGAELLASTWACANQVFRIGEQVLAVQFHPEVTPDLIRAMIDNEGHELVNTPYIQTAADMLSLSSAIDGREMSFLKDWL